MATPTILPVPTVAERAVISAPKLDTSPLLLPLSSFLNTYFDASGSLAICIPLVLTVRRIPPNKISTINGTPHINPSIFLSKH